MLTPVKNVRIKSVTPEALVQLRFGKAAVKDDENDVFVTAKLKAHREEGEKHLVVFEETDADGKVSETTISRFPGAPWRHGNQYVSLVAVDESTFNIQKASAPIQTDAIGKAIQLIGKELDDVYGGEQLIALLNEIQTGKRVNVGIKALANKLAAKLVDELSNLPDSDKTAE